MARKSMSDSDFTPVLEHPCGSMVGGPGASGNSDPGPDPDHPTQAETEADVTITAVRTPRHRDDEILCAIADIEDVRTHATNARLRLIRTAKSLGITNVDIADSLGMTEAGVRQILSRGV